jgi:hypothetical protein
MGAISSKEGDPAKQEEINRDRNCVPTATAESSHPKDQINKDHETTTQPFGFKIISSLKKVVEILSATDDKKTQHAGYVVFM